MTTLQAERHPVDRLAEEFVQRYRRGERPAISEYVEKYPELAGELQELLAALVLIEEHGRAQLQSGSSGQRLADRPAPVQLGEYRVLREIGRGGMGVVFEAVQESLGRHVALKVLPSHALLDAVRLKRFQHEAQAAARLHHTNIVPIFGVGTAEGVHFYAMQFIQGRGLDEVIDELRALRANDRISRSPSPGDNASEAVAEATTVRASLSTMSDTPRYYRSVANLGAQVAEALDHAHRHEVLHRDIKPSNLLLDAAGTVWITDFGLAKAAGTEELTHPGDLVGTLRYMAPEQLRGRGDARADIYSLGSTLYELLTLRPAFNAPDRAALVRQIVQDDPPLPRKLDSKIPRDLETIVLKAMAHDPASRYPNAAAMAADLRRFLDDKPIAARSVGVPERLWRWCLRRPALASLAAGLLLSLVAGIAGVLSQWVRAEAILKEARRQEGIAVNLLDVGQREQRRAEEAQRRAEREAEEAARQRTIAQEEASHAEVNYQTARQAVDELLTVVSEDTLLAQPGLQPVRLNLLTRALKFYEERWTDRDQDPVARRALARSYLRLGVMKHNLGPAGSQASDAYRQAIALLQRPDAQASEDRATTIWLARAESQLGQDQIERHQLSEASATLAQARQRLERLLERTPDDEAAQSSLGRTLNSLGYLVSLAKEIPSPERYERAIEIHDRALAIHRRLAERHSEDAIVRYNVSVSLSNMARRYQSLRRYDESRALLEECLHIRQEVAPRRPDILDFQFGVASSFNALGDVIRDSNLPAPERAKLAIEHYELALEIYERMVRENPAVLRYRQELANIPLNVSDVCAKQRYDQQALDWRIKEIAAWDACVALDPGNAEIRAMRANRLDGQAPLEERLGLYTDALNSRIRAHQAWREIQKDPSQLAPNRANIQRNLTYLMIELARHDRADDLCAVAREWMELGTETPAEMISLAFILERPFRYLRRGEPLDEQIQAQVAEYQRLAIKFYRDAVKAAPSEVANYTKTRPHLAIYQALVKLDATLARDSKNIDALVERARILRQLGDLAACQQDWEQALSLIDAALKKSPKNMVLHRHRTRLYSQACEWQQVVRAASRGLSYQANDEILLNHRGSASFHLGQPQQAYDDFTRMLQTTPENVRYWPERCTALLEMGRESDARADAKALVDLAANNAQFADSIIWRFLLHHNVARFPEATLALAQQAAERHKNNKEYRGELGGVQFYIGHYRDAIENLAPAAAGSAGRSSAMTGFWLAMCHYHLGEPDKAQAAFVRAVRNWKAIAAMPPYQEDLIRSIWQEAKTLLGDFDGPPQFQLSL